MPACTMRRAQGSSLLKVLTVAVASAVGIFLSGPHFAVEGQASASLIGIVLQEGSDPTASWRQAHDSGDAAIGRD